MSTGGMHPRPRRPPGCWTIEKKGDQLSNKESPTPYRTASDSGPYRSATRSGLAPVTNSPLTKERMRWADAMEEAIEDQEEAFWHVAGEWAPNEQTRKLKNIPLQVQDTSSCSSSSRSASSEHSRHHYSNSQIPESLARAHGEHIVYTMDSSGASSGLRTTTDSNSDDPLHGSSMISSPSSSSFRTATDDNSDDPLHGDDFVRTSQGTATMDSRRSDIRRRWSGGPQEKLDGPQEKIAHPEFALGDLPSIGSKGHASKKCRPCIFVQSWMGCNDGQACTFCHFEHEKSKNRPCKAKRDRFWKVMGQRANELEAALPQEDGHWSAFPAT